MSPSQSKTRKRKPALTWTETQPTDLAALWESEGGAAKILRDYCAMAVDPEIENHRFPDMDARLEATSRRKLMLRACTGFLLSASPNVPGVPRTELDRAQKVAQFLTFSEWLDWVSGLVFLPDDDSEGPIEPTLKELCRTWRDDSMCLDPRIAPDHFPELLRAWWNHDAVSDYQRERSLDLLKRLRIAVEDCNAPPEATPTAARCKAIVKALCCDFDSLVRELDAEEYADSAGAPSLHGKILAYQANAARLDAFQHEDTRSVQPHAKPQTESGRDREDRRSDSQLPDDDLLVQGFAAWCSRPKHRPGQKWATALKRFISEQYPAVGLSDGELTRLIDRLYKKIHPGTRKSILRGEAPSATLARP